MASRKLIASRKDHIRRVEGGNNGQEDGTVTRRVEGEDSDQEGGRWGQ